MNSRELIIKKYNINPIQTFDVFYENGEVWSEGNYSVFHCGEMKATYQDETLYTSEDFIKIGLDTDDKVLLASNDNELYWHLNPWFIVAHKDDLDQEEYISGDIVDAIQYALLLEAQDNQPWGLAPEKGYSLYGQETGLRDSDFI